MQLKLISHPLSRLEKILLIALCLLASIGLWYGWRHFWYLTDDAFIYFRYASNSVLGYGYVWNAPPFRPVEGYTSFLWLVLLDLTWRFFHIVPPDSANWLSLLFAGLALITFALMVLNLPWNERLRPFRICFLGFGLLGILTNTTFLAWTSSGLETALFNLSLLLWIYCFLYLPYSNMSWVAGISGSALLVYLSRPDGILFALTTLCALSVRAIMTKDVKPIYAIPLIGIPLHLLWRKSFYGEWLPNTYYAKAIPGRIWWQSGYRYFLSFVIEYAVWFWIALVIGYIAIRTVSLLRQKRIPARLRELDTQPLLRLAVIATLFAHFLYYTFVIGGDHFEYRVYSHLVPLLFVSLIWVVNRIRVSPAMSLSILLTFIVVSWPIQWLNWWRASQALDFTQARKLTISVSAEVRQAFPQSPPILLGYLGYYDQLQSWLTGHYVCARLQNSRMLTQHLLEIFPSRDQGLKMDANHYPVTTQEAVGVLSWVLPRVNIIDLLGLNDYVIARNPILRDNEHMAHERQPPPGYVACFEPNIRIRYKKIIRRPRPVQLTPEMIVTCEKTFSDRVAASQP